MGSPDSRYVSNQDYGRRLYVPDKEYGEQMGVGSRKVAFTQNTAAYQQSNLKKPYREDDYDDMEYLADPFVGYTYPWSFDNPEEIGDAQQDDDTPYSPWTVKFFCWSDACYGYGEEHCEPLNCNWPVTGFHIHSIPDGCTTTLTANQICAGCPEGEMFWISFDVIMLATFQHNGATVKVEGRYYNMKMSPCIGLCDDTGIAYSAASDDTIIRESTAAVAITDSLGTQGSPYSWAVSGTGFTFDNAITTGLTNTLNADASACGIARITVTGCDGTEVTGWVKCTFGAWNVDQAYPSSSPLPAGCDITYSPPYTGQCWCSSGGPTVNFDLIHMVDTEALTGGTAGGPGDCYYGVSLDVTYTYADGYQVTQLQIFNAVFSDNPSCNEVGCWTASNLMLWGC